jgi:hypothetical protein
LQLEDIFKIATAIIGSLGGGALLVAAFSSWLGKIWANRIMQKDKSKHEQDLEEIKNKFKKLEIEHNVVFSELHKRRAEVVEKLHHLIVDTLALVGGLLAIKEWDSEESKQDYAQKTWDQFRGLLDYFTRYKIYLDKELSEYITQFLKQLDNDRKRYTKHSHDMEINQISSDECLKSWESFNENAPKAMEKLEEEFRQLIGVKNITNGST